MVANVPPEGNGHPSDELGPELREAVEAVLRDQPPPDCVKETLEELRRRSGRTAPRKSLRFVTWTALAAAACIVVIVLLGRSRVADDGQEVVKEPSKRPVEARAPVQGEPARPTLWVYRQAVGQSPEALDELLDRHARELLPPSSPAELGALWQELL